MSQSEIRNQKSAILLCPGQGAQHVGMGKGWYERSAAARRTFAEAEAAVGMEIGKRCFEGPEDRLNRTDVAQVAIYVTSVACYQGLLEAGALGGVAATAGLSLGEFTALHLAGAIDFVTGLKLVQLRGQAMQAAAEASPSGMVALSGADEAQANLACEQALQRGPGEGEVLVPANFNCPGQIVLSGHLSACERVVKVAAEIGLKATVLKVAGAFHSPLMRPAAQQLAAALEQVSWSVPKVAVMSNVTAQLHEASRPESIRQRLVEQLTQPVRWEQSMAWMIAHVPGRFVELAPGKVLSGLMRRIDRAVKVENHAEP